MLKSFYKILYIILIALVNITFSANALDVYMVSNVTGKRFYGFRYQSLSVMQALRNSGKVSKSKEFDINKLPDLKKEILKSKSYKSVLISAGGYGIECLKNIRNEIPIYQKDVTSVWTGHHIFEDLRDGLKYIDIIALPEYVITEEFKDEAYKWGVILVPTPTIPSVASKSANRDAYKNFRFNHKIPLKQKYLVVFYGGAAPDESGRVKEISRSEIRNMGYYINQISREKKLKVVLSSTSRTTAEEMKELRSHLRDKDAIFFDFADGMKSYEALLYLLKKSEGSTALVTGESTSMVDETLQSHQKPIYVFRAGNMSNAHFRHLEYEKSLGNVVALDGSYMGHVAPLGEKISGFSVPSDVLIAKAIKEFLKK